MFSRTSAIAVGLVTSALDLGLTSFFVSQNVGFDVVQYNFYSSLLDFALLAVARVALHLGCLIGVNVNRADGPTFLQRAKTIFACITMLFSVYSLVKLLALAEVQLNISKISYQFWVLFSSNLFFSFLLAPVILLVYGKVQSPLVTVVNDDLESTSDVTPILQATESISTVSKNADKKAKEEVEKLNRQEKVSILLRLLKYCAYEWVWYSLGFAFLIIYSVCK